MDKLEIFIADILKKGIDIDPLEQSVKDVFDERLLAFSTLAPPNSLNYSINLYDVLIATYKTLLKNNVKIICLVFSDENKIYIEKRKLYYITFFRNYFTDNDVVDNVNIIIELPMGGILDDYDSMCHVIEFVKSGYTNCICTDYLNLNKLIKINDYLLDVISEDNVKYNKSLLSMGKHTYSVEHEQTLKEFLINSLKKLLHTLDHEICNDFEYSDSCFTLIHEFCKILGIVPDRICLVNNNSIYYKHMEEFVKSPLAAYYNPFITK